METEIVKKWMSAASTKGVTDMLTVPLLIALNSPPVTTSLRGPGSLLLQLRNPVIERGRIERELGVPNAVRNHKGSDVQPGGKGQHQRM